MDVTLYYEILRWHGEDPSKLDHESNPPKQVRSLNHLTSLHHTYIWCLCTLVQMGLSMFHRDILLRKAVWTNRKRRDFKYWLRSFHPLYGLLSAPKLHPYSRQYRLANIAFLIFIGAFWSVLSCFCESKLFETDHMLYLKLLMIAFINSVFLYFIEWIFIKLTRFQSTILSIPGCILITFAIISILGSMVIAVAIEHVKSFVFVFSLQLIPFGLQ